MAIYHLSFQNISASNNRGIIASASYRSGEKLFDEKQQKEFYYTRSVKPETYILKPNYAPDWCLNREKLWNEVVKKEKQKNARYAKEFNVALPIELSEEEQKNLILEYCQKNFVDRGMVADIAIHRDHKNNPHAHVLLTNRPFNKDGTWGEKSKKIYINDENGNPLYTEAGYRKSRKEWLIDWDKKSTLNEWRRNWETLANEYLKRNGFEIEIKADSFETQKINKEPTEHYGVKKIKKSSLIIKKSNREIRQEKR